MYPCKWFTKILSYVNIYIVVFYTDTFLYGIVEAHCYVVTTIELI